MVEHDGLLVVVVVVVVGRETCQQSQDETSAEETVQVQSLVENHEIVNLEVGCESVVVA